MLKNGLFGAFSGLWGYFLKDCTPFGRSNRYICLTTSTNNEKDPLPDVPGLLLRIRDQG